MPAIPLHDIVYYQNRYGWLLTRTSCSIGRSSLQPYSLAQRYRGNSNKVISNHVPYLSGLQLAPGRRETSCRYSRRFSRIGICVSVPRFSEEEQKYDAWPTTVQPVHPGDGNGAARVYFLLL